MAKRLRDAVPVGAVAVAAPVASRLGPLEPGDNVWVFLRCDGSPESPFVAPNTGAALLSPRLGWTHSWQPATVAQVLPSGAVEAELCDLRFATRTGDPPGDPRPKLQFPVKEVRRRAGGAPPSARLSVVALRWGGVRPVPEPVGESGAAGGWGDLGANVCDTYIAAFFESLHKALGPTYEVLCCFVSESADLARLFPQAVAALLRSSRTAGFYFLWPAEWLHGIEGRPGYVSAADLFGAMRGFEAAGIPSRHPHPSHLYQLLVSKSWTTTCCLAPAFAVPATTRVTRADIVSDPQRCAAAALRALAGVRAARGAAAAAPAAGAPGADGPRSDRADRGVVKLGYSWEAQDVWPFAGEAELAKRLRAVTRQQGCTADSVFVQEYVESDLELRMYIIEGRARRVLYTRFGGLAPDGSPSAFQCLSDRDEAVRLWLGGDAAAMRAAERAARRLSRRWRVWLLCENCELPPAYRVDFFVRRTGPGTAAVTTGEITEQGASTLGWDEGAAMVFDAVVRACRGTAVAVALGAGSSSSDSEGEEAAAAAADSARSPSARLQRRGEPPALGMG